jgi:hypothetical protein
MMSDMKSKGMKTHLRTFGLTMIIAWALATPPTSTSFRIFFTTDWSG